MKHSLVLLTTVFLAALHIGNAQNARKEAINAASLLSGSFMRATPPSYTSTDLMVGDVQNYTPEALFDQSPKLWCSAENAHFPHVFQIELTETFLIEKLEFDNRCENYPGIAAKDVIVHFAMDARSPRFERVGSYSLDANAVNSFSIAAREARIIKIEITSNHGNAQYTELAEFKAFGRPKLMDIQTVDVDGTWRSNWGDVFFNQKNTLLDGSYIYNNGKIPFGGINRNQITYRWVETKIDRAGQTLMFLNQEGTRLTGIWCYDDNWSEFGFWILERKNGVPFAQAKLATIEPDVEIVDAVVEEMHKELTDSKKLVLYGINFRTNSSEILPSSRSVLRQVAELLLANPDIRIRIEGHTDSDGSVAHNDRLSQERAFAVQSYFVHTHRIAIDRITIDGKGERFPVSTNDTELGKAANRRVEIHWVDE